VTLSLYGQFLLCELSLQQLLSTPLFVGFRRGKEIHQSPPTHPRNLLRAVWRRHFIWVISLQQYTHYALERQVCKTENIIWNINKEITVKTCWELYFDQHRYERSHQILQLYLLTRYCIMLPDCQLCYPWLLSISILVYRSRASWMNWEEVGELGAESTRGFPENIFFYFIPHIGTLIMIYLEDTGTRTEFVAFFNRESVFSCQTSL